LLKLKKKPEKNEKKQRRLRELLKGKNKRQLRPKRLWMRQKQDVRRNN